MNQKSFFSLWQLLGFAVTSLGGTLLHFLYDWTNQSVLIAPFSAVNESTWEHMKLIFFPMFLFALIESRFFRERNDFWCIKLIGIATGLALIPVLFYTYNGVLGKSPALVNIGIFFVAAGAAYLLERQLYQSGGVRCRSPKLAFAAICAIGLAFVLFTFATPALPIFRDPITGTYGI